MSDEHDSIPELKQILGALIFGCARPLAVSEIRRVLQQVGESQGGFAADFAKVKDADIRAALETLADELTVRKLGFQLVEVAAGFRLQTDPACGAWLRHLLEVRQNRLSRPALETLAVIAYRQPVTRSEIEAVRGVNADHIVRNLQEMQLIRIVGRSELPGRPMLYATTSLFLEHFGLRKVEELPAIEQLRATPNQAAPKQTPAEEGKKDEQDGEENEQTPEQDAQ